MKQTASLYSKFPLKPAFFKGVFVIFKKLSQKRIHFWITRQNSSMEGDEVGIFSKAPDWKPLFLLKIKIKQNTGYPNKEYNLAFKHFPQHIRVYPRSKKKYALKMIRKILHIENLSKVRCLQIWCVPNTVRVFWEESRGQENF